METMVVNYYSTVLADKELSKHGLSWFVQFFQAQWLDLPPPIVRLSSADLHFSVGVVGASKHLSQLAFDDTSCCQMVTCVSCII